MFAAMVQSRPDACQSWPLASALKPGTLPSSVSAARHHTARTLSRWNLEYLADAAQTVVSELVTNAIVHGAGPVTVRLRANHERLIIEVQDALPAPPEPRQPEPDDEGGRGLEIVSLLSHCWGYYAERHGKVVWAFLLRR
jgi:anti-sigma regulatory factor (Ser/Thr protein kinase)